ncbi:hypothetical protein MPSEU_000316800 [Mayamaea pseudoterrestris]|nr:hypothetical protein MPSEU_000316800 [Mayamaea pseudoterrestris]
MNRDDCGTDSVPSIHRQVVSKMDSKSDNEHDLRSPSSVCIQRKLSVAVTTNDDVEHEYLEGRPKIVVPQKSNKLKLAGLTRPGSLFKRASTVPMDQDRERHFRPHGVQDFCRIPAPLNVEYWSEPTAETFKVRSKLYLNTRLKAPSDASVFQFLACDLVQVSSPILTGLCAHPQERVQQALRRQGQTGLKELPEFIFAVNYCLPAGAAAGGFTHWVAYFGTDNVAQLNDESTPLGRVCKPFFFGDSDQFRRERFKLIPHVVQGNIIIRKAVGSKPSILGRKLKQYYVRNPRFFEVIVDIASDPVAERIVKLALGGARHLVVDMMFLLEGTCAEELPERILGATRIQHLDLKTSSLQRFVTNV